MTEEVDLATKAPENDEDGRGANPAGPSLSVYHIHDLDDF